MMRIKKRRTIAGALADLRLHFGQFCHLAIFTRLVFVSLVLPVLAIVLRLWMAIRGESAIGDAEIWEFFTSFPGVLAPCFALVAGLLLLFVEQAVLMTMVYGAIDGRRIGWVAALGYVARRSGTILHLAAVLIGRLAMLALPFCLLAILLVQLALGKYHGLYEERDLFHFLYDRPPGLGWVVAGLIFLLVVMLVILSWRAVRWLLAIPATLFERLGARGAIRDSIADSRGHRWQLAGLFSLWAATGWIAGYLGTFAIGKIGRSAVALAGDSPGWIAFIIGATGLVAIVFWLSISFLALALFASSTVRVYRHCSGPGELPVVAGETSLGDTGSRGAYGESLLLGAVGAIALAGLTAAVLLSELERPPERPQIVAHRGDSANAPENTVAAVRRAIDEGADWVEIDVQLTRDGVVVVFHDVVINQIVTGDGRRVANFELDGIGLKKDEDGRILRGGDGQVLVIDKRSKEPAGAVGGGQWIYLGDSDYQELKGIDVGSWWVDRHGYGLEGGEDFRGLVMPTLDEVLAVCQEAGVRVLIELKYDGAHDQKELVDKVKPIIEPSEVASQVVVMTMEEERLGEMLDAMGGQQATGQFFPFKPRRSDVDPGIDLVGVHKLAAGRRFIAFVGRRGQELYVYTMDDPFGISTMMGRGVDGIITNDPGLAGRVSEARADQGALMRLLVAVGSEVGMMSIFK